MMLCKNPQSVLSAPLARRTFVRGAIVGGVILGICELATPPAQAAPSSDLYFVKTRNTGSGAVEVHSATADSDYKSAGLHSVSWMSPEDADNGWFQMVGSDLFFVKTRNTGSGAVEVHSATADSDYKSAGLHSVSWLSPEDADNGTYGIPPASPASGQVAQEDGGPVGDDYPSNLKGAAQDALVDPWRFYNRECTSFVAWCLNSRNGIPFTNSYAGVHWGNAHEWGSAARSAGFGVDDSPERGAVAWWSAGHVAWVSGVSGSDVSVEEYNYGYSGQYHTRTVSASQITGFIHIH